MEALQQIEYLSPAPDYSPTTTKLQVPFKQRMVQWTFASLGRLGPGIAGRIAYRLFSTPRSRAKHKSSDPVLESARLFEVLYGGQILKAYEWGRGEQTILLVHGWESRGTALRSFVPALLEKGYRVVAFDGPAHGNSGGKRTNLPHFGGAIRAVINHLGGVHSIICHSFGGASTVFTLWSIEPKIKVEKLVLVAVPNDMRLVLKSAAKAMNLPPIVKRKFKSILESILGLPLETVKMENANGQINVADALIVHDKADDVVPFSSGQSLFEGWDNASMLVTEGYGHYRLMRQKPVIDRVAGFIAQD